jgi:hypothetical protein
LRTAHQQIASMTPMVNTYLVAYQSHFTAWTQGRLQPMETAEAAEARHQQATQRATDYQTALTRIQVLEEEGRQTAITRDEEKRVYAEECGRLTRAMESAEVNMRQRQQQTQDGVLRLVAAHRRESAAFQRQVAQQTGEINTQAYMLEQNQRVMQVYKDTIDRRESTIAEMEFIIRRRDETIENMTISCIVCLDGPPAYAFLPCGHIVCCHECRQRLLRMARVGGVQRPPRCPVCDASVTSSHRVYAQGQ